MEFISELSDDDERWARLVRRVGFAAHLEQRLRDSKGENLPEGIVQQTVFWLTDDHGRVHGELRLRHQLSEALLAFGGHIGYIVRPSSRQQGLGKLILSLGLEEARRLGLERVLITCDDDNLGSIGVIQANGGREYSTGISPQNGKPTRLYWIEV